MVLLIMNVLDRLGDKLLAPVWERLASVETLSIIPHGPLHALPFQALRQNGRYLIETHAVSYAPSAAVLNYCWSKSAARSHEQPFDGTALLVGVPDERATQVSQEIQTLAALISGSRSWRDTTLGEFG
jgi:CHAT domain-containing protein